MNLKTRLRSTIMRNMASERSLERRRAKARKHRVKNNEPPTVHYFHQVDDPYSHLAVQKLDQLKSRYSVHFQPHLTEAPESDYQGSPQHFARWAVKDAAEVASFFGTDFLGTEFFGAEPSVAVDTPSQDSVQTANEFLAPHLKQTDFADIAIDVGRQLWSGQLSADGPSNAAVDALREGTAKRQALGHYQGAMFYFEGEWYWGVDRIRFLEQRLNAEGFDQKPSEPLCVPEPQPPAFDERSREGITLEYFPSLRSPYTAIGHQRVLDLIANSGVTVKVRPVMPMMMRGIPAPQNKAKYILSDAAREGRTNGVPMGRIVDPFGDPVRRAFALFPAADNAGRGMEFVTAYLQAAWFDGLDITKAKVLRQVVESAGLDWQSTQDASQSQDWQAILESNLAVLHDHNLWGVPSFRVTGGNSDEPYACWGQDRIWRVAHEIASRA